MVVRFFCDLCDPCARVSQICHIDFTPHTTAPPRCAKCIASKSPRKVSTFMWWLMLNGRKFSGRKVSYRKYLGSKLPIWNFIHGRELQRRGGQRDGRSALRRGNASRRREYSRPRPWASSTASKERSTSAFACLVHVRLVTLSARSCCSPPMPPRRRSVAPRWPTGRGGGVAARVRGEDGDRGARGRLITLSISWMCEHRSKSL